MGDLEALRAMKTLSDQALHKKKNELPAAIQNQKGSDVFYRNLKPTLHHYMMDDEKIVQTILHVLEILHSKAIVDWHINDEKKRVIHNAIDDYLYEAFKAQ